jgi:4-oxalomesaconate hydratase
MLFEPHQPELCNFTPTVFVDITPVLDAKREAMSAIESQAHLHVYYTQQSEQRGNHARRVSGNPDIRCAEAFQRVLPQVVTEL